MTTLELSRSVSMCSFGFKMISWHLWANVRVPTDSWKEERTGPKVARRTIFESALREFVKMRVSLELRYGIKSAFWVPALRPLLGDEPEFARQEITFPRAVRLELICLASSKRIPFE